MYIVGEYLFLENLIINYLILQSTKIITRTKVKKNRIIITSILAALYPFVFFYPSLILLTRFSIKLIISMIIVKIAFNSKSLKLFIKQLSAFYVVSFVFAGASIGLYYFINNSNGIFFENIFIRFPVKYLVVGVVVGKLMIKSIMYYYHQKITTEKEIVNVIVYYNNGNSTVLALNDTGNSLVEPISKLPVFVIEYNAISNLLPLSIKGIHNNKGIDFAKLEKCLEYNNEKWKFKLIPFKAIGNDCGLILGFKPDYVQVFDKYGNRKYEDLLIGIYEGVLTTDHQYNGLFNLNILRGDLGVN